jgi:hypothetical protein
MKEKIIIHGANFKASVMVDPSICQNIYMEAATRVMENTFGHGPDSELSDEFNIEMEDDDLPSLGPIMCCHKEGISMDDENNAYWVFTERVAENAGLPEIVKMCINAREKMTNEN